MHILVQVYTWDKQHGYRYIRKAAYLSRVKIQNHAIDSPFVDPVYSYWVATFNTNYVMVQTSAQKKRGEIQCT